jgi:membrane-associated HD superfamily phosphohydrolase
MKTRRATRRTSFVTPFAAWRDAVLYRLVRALRWFRPTTRFVLGFSVLTLVTTLLLAKTHSPMSAEFYKEGDVVRANVISPADIAVEDQTATVERRLNAQATVLPVWNYDAARSEAGARRLRALWQDSQRQPETRAGSNTRAAGERRAATGGDAGDESDESVARAVNAHRSDPSALERLTRLLREANEGYIYEDRFAQ